MKKPTPSAWRWATIAHVSRIEDLTPTIKGLWLTLDGAGLAFQAGQYLNLEIPGLTQARAFSIASAPSVPNDIELHMCVKSRAAPARPMCTNSSSRRRVALHRAARPLLRAQVGAEPMLFLAGGSGLSSPKAMIVDVLEAGDTRAITLIHGARSREEFYCRELFESLAARHANFRYVPALSDADDDDWQGERGYVHEVAERLFDGRFAGLTAYLCGPPAMIDACITSLMRGRLFEEHIFMEHFFTAADAASPARRSALFKKF